MTNMTSYQLREQFAVAAAKLPKAAIRSVSLSHREIPR